MNFSRVLAPGILASAFLTTEMLQLGHKSIAAAVQCTEQEVEAALWKPSARNAYMLFAGAELESGARVPVNGPFSERSKVLSALWAQAKSTGECQKFEALAGAEREAVRELAEDWDAFLSGWLEERAVERAPAASRERPKPAPVVKKEKTTTKAENQRPATVVQVHVRLFVCVCSCACVRVSQRCRSRKMQRALWGLSCGTRSSRRRPLRQRPSARFGLQGIGRTLSRFCRRPRRTRRQMLRA